MQSWCAQVDASRIEALMSVYLARTSFKPLTNGERARGMGGARSTAVRVLTHTGVDLV